MKIYFGNVYEDRLSACKMFLIVLGAISNEKMHTKNWNNVCEVHFCFKENIVPNTLDTRTLKNKDQYEGFQHHKNQRRKKLE